MNLEQTVSTTIAELAKITGDSNARLAELTGHKTRAAIQRKFANKSPWSLAEVEIMAKHFNVTPCDLVKGKIPASRGPKAPRPSQPETPARPA